MSTVVTFERRNAEKQTVSPGRRKNADYRGREYLDWPEVLALVKAAKQNRNPDRDQAMIYMGARHGLRVSELTGLTWDQVHLDRGAEVLDVKRLKGSQDSKHPLDTTEIRLLNALRKVSDGSRYVFVSERRGKLSSAAVQKLLERLAPVAGLNIKVHPHMLRHAAGHKFANEGKDTRSLQLWLGHRNIRHTVAYTQLSDRCFKGW